ncbi:MAG TPA: heparan-alpha-glucosaminide N-acetyltransferase domain-containing protein [Methyloceanibacter sp.]|nr:heparan-alpha-glucosaminide N-acetyltransferase domain-containing protein [Methyloceanibacter sp.]
MIPQTPKHRASPSGVVASQSRSDAAPRDDATRIASVDILRGLVIVVMALDHTRDFFGAGGFNPRDVTEPALFLTRWITHLCAPTFILLSGLSAFLYGRGRSIAETSRFLLTRGLWLILIEFTVIRLAWSFDLTLGDTLVGGVIWVIGASMVALSALVWLPSGVIVTVALAMIAGHNLFDGLDPGVLGGAAPLWHVLHDPGAIRLSEGLRFYVLYPLIPWIGVMAAGYALGPVMQLGADERKRVLLKLGAAITIGFVVLRVTNLYGDPAAWSVQGRWLATLLSFLNCEKYPPSLLFLMMTLGPALMLLGAFEQARGAWARVLAVFGQVPFFFYVVHIYLLHALAVATGLAMTGAFVSNPEIGLGLAGIYLVWLVAVILLYPVCRWFAGLKERGSGWWWSYL